MHSSEGFCAILVFFSWAVVDPHRLSADGAVSHHVITVKGSLSVRYPFADCGLVFVSAFKGSDCPATGDWVASSRLLAAGAVGSVGRG